jgi:hypothetical protein
MTATTLIDILDRNDVHGYMLVNRSNGSIFSVTHLEAKSDGTHLRSWTFRNDGTLWHTSSRLAPKGELELLELYAEDAELYDDEDGLPTFRCVWC